jgi:hypothetical protein
MQVFWDIMLRQLEEPVTKLMIIEKIKPFYDEMKVNDKSTFSECWQQSLSAV